MFCKCTFLSLSLCWLVVVAVGVARGEQGKTRIPVAGPWVWLDKQDSGSPEEHIIIK